MAVIGNLIKRRLINVGRLFISTHIIEYIEGKNAFVGSIIRVFRINKFKFNGDAR